MQQNSVLLIVPHCLRHSSSHFSWVWFHNRYIHIFMVFDTAESTNLYKIWLVIMTATFYNTVVGDWSAESRHQLRASHLKSHWHLLDRLGLTEGSPLLFGLVIARQCCEAECLYAVSRLWKKSVILSPHQLRGLVLITFGGLMFSSIQCDSASQSQG